MQQKTPGANSIKGFNLKITNQVDLPLKTNITSYDGQDFWKEFVKTGSPKNNWKPLCV